MKKYVLTIFALFTISLALFSCAQPGTDNSSVQPIHRDSGKVKVAYIKNSLGIPVSHIDYLYNEDGSWTTTEYNLSNNIYSINNYRKDGKLIVKCNVNSNQLTKYEYDENGNLIKEEIYQDPSYPILCDTKVYYYNNKNLVINEIRYGRDGKKDLEYNCTEESKGNMIGIKRTETNYEKNRTKFDSLFFYEFDSKGNIIKKESMSENNELMETTTYQYDDNNNLLKEVCRNKDSKIVYEMTQTFDSNNHILTYVYKSDYWNYNIEYSYEYEYY